jgi:hypothetical protein
VGSAMHDQSEMKNICSGMIHEMQEGIRAIGCPTSVGCFKGKELENIIKGSITSKLNDARESSEILDKKIECLKETIGELWTSNKSSIEIIARAEKAVDRMDKYVIGLFVSLLLMVAATVWGNLAKLGQDSKNQIETASYLKTLSDTIATLETKLNKIPENQWREKHGQ